MNDKKTISINTAYFKQSGNKKSNNQTRSRKPKPLSIIAPNDLKRNLIKKVKEHQHNLHNSYNQNNTNETKNGSNNDQKMNRFFPDEFKESLDYLVQLSKQHKENTQNTQNTQNTPIQNSYINPQNSNNQQKRNINSFYNTPSNFQLEQVDIELPISLKDIQYSSPNLNTTLDKSNISQTSNDDKPYGCLKNGFKPTYRNYMKTLKKRPTKNDNINGSNRNNLNHIKNFVHTTYKNKNLRSTDFRKSKSSKYVTKQIKTRRFKCGRNKKTRKVGVVLKSGKTRSKVLAEKQNIKARPYAQMKNELYKKGLLKIGTNAPRNLVTEIYENCILSGDVLNKNKDVLIHNYMNDTQKEY
jgi:hypothetical protein